MAYNEFAYIYDKLMQEDIDYDAWCDYLENLFTAHDCELDTICELACGTGNMTVRLEKRGYTMTGVDLSADMLAVASEKLNNSELLCCDMAHFKPLKKYDAALCMIDGVNYVVTPKALLNTFTNIRNALKQDGLFIFDVSTRYKLENILGSETYIHSDYDIFYSWQNQYIEKYNLCDMLLNFFVREGDTYHRFEERHLQRGYSEHELRILLKKAGFTEVTVYGELSMEKPAENAERIVFVCK